jgi:hypothetical protein
MSFESAVINIHKKAFQTFQKVAEAASRGQGDVEGTWKEFHQACSGTAKSSTDAAREEWRKHVMGHLMHYGMSEADAEQWFNGKWEDVKKLADKMLKTEPKVVEAAKAVETATKFGFFKFVGVVTAIFAGVMAFSFSQRGPTLDQIRMQNTIRTIEIQAEQIKQMEQIMVSNEEFNMATASLFAAPAPVIPADPAPAAAALPAPAAAALPPPIAAVAAQPVQVVETDSNGEVEAVTTTTVGRAYQSIPREAQRQMESSPPPKIEHDYDKPSTKDCFRDDCLGAIDKQFGHKSASFTSGDGSMTINVNSPTR